MIKRVVKHIQGNAIAYVALFFAVGGGGGYAVAATTAATTTVHACVSKKNHAVYIDKKCGKTTTALLLDQRGPAGATGAQGPAGTNAVVAYGTVSAGGELVGGSSGLSSAEISPGEYSITVTAAPCSTSNTEFPVVSAADGTPANSVAVLSTAPSGSAGSFNVSAGLESNGTYTPGGQDFDVQVACAS